MVNRGEALSTPVRPSRRSCLTETSSWSFDPHPPSAIFGIAHLSQISKVGKNFPTQKIFVEKMIANINKLKMFRVL